VNRKKIEDREKIKEKREKVKWEKMVETSRDLSVKNGRDAIYRVSLIIRKQNETLSKH